MAILRISLCLGVAAAAFVEPPAPASVRAGVAARSAASPVMIIDQMKAAAKEVEFAAAEAIVAKKVQEKLDRAKEKYNIPENYEGVMTGFFTSYMTEVYKAGGDVDYYESVLTELFKKVLFHANEPYKFPPFHEAIREPFDYYKLGNDFAKGVIKRDTSLILGLDNVDKMLQQIADGDNVVLLANHQSEADPQILSVLMDEAYPGFAERTIFVAGDRVTTDMLAQPFSMGRNLLCIFSKKHVDNPPELKSEKTRHNRNVMKQMQKLFKDGGKVIWVAPSGGRDRANANGEYEVAPFDAKSVEMFRLMADKAGRTTHFYPFSMLTYPVCPPPQSVGGAVGEQRTVKWSPAGLHFGDEVDLEQYMQACIVDGFPSDCDPAAERELVRDALASHVHEKVVANYQGLVDGLQAEL